MTKAMQKIVPFLWFDDQAEEAAKFYASVFKHSKIGEISRYPETAEGVPEEDKGRVMTVEFELEGFKFIGLNGGPQFKFTPAISFMVDCGTATEVDKLWNALIDGGMALMPLDKYPFSEKYGWVEDKYGVNWQVMLAQEKAAHAITPSMMFVGEQCGKAEEAVHFYTTVFKGSEVGSFFRYEEGQQPDKAGTIAFADFQLEGQMFAAMDSGREHGFTFNEAISFEVDCKDQEEVDHYWDKLSAVPEAEQCGWLKDKYGVSWQIVPTVLSEMLSDPDKEKSGRVMEAMLKMKKLDIKGLKQASKNKPLRSEGKLSL